MRARKVICRNDFTFNCALGGEPLDRRNRVCGTAAGGHEKERENEIVEESSH
jgi:hypothetical protein